MTDKFCLVLFFSLLAAFAIVSANNIRSSQFRAILSPVDSAGVVCGQNINSVNAEAFKYLYVDYPDKGESALSKRVCVKECPTASDSMVQCLPNSFVTSCETLKVHPTKRVASRLCVPTDLTYYKQISQQLYGIDSSVVFDALISNHKLIGLSALLAFVFALVYSKLLAKSALVVVVVTFLSAYAGLGYFGYSTYIKSASLLEESNSAPDATKMKKAAGSYKMGAYTLWTVVGSLTLITALLLKRIRAAVGVLQNAGNFMVQNKSVLVIPILAFLAGITVTIVWAVSALAFVSNKKIASSENSTFAQVDIRNQSWQFWLIVGSFCWALAAIFSGVKFSVTTAVCLWHLEGESSSFSRTFKALYWTIRYHLGSVIFGSLVLLVAGVCKSVCQYVVSRVPSTGSVTDVHWLLSRCIMCLVSMAERAVKYFTDQVYCQIALSSESFCTSARSVSKYSTADTIKFDAICELLLFAGRLLISVLATLVSKIALEKNTFDLATLNGSAAKLVTLALVFGIAWTVSSIFTFIWGAACDSIITLQAMDQQTFTARCDSKCSQSVNTSMEMIGNTNDYI